MMFGISARYTLLYIRLFFDEIKKELLSDKSCAGRKNMTNLKVELASVKEAEVIRLFANPHLTNGCFQREVDEALRWETQKEIHKEIEGSVETFKLQQLMTILRTKMPRAEARFHHRTLYRGMTTNLLHPTEPGNIIENYHDGHIITWPSFVWVSPNLEGAKLSMNGVHDENTGETILSGSLVIVRIPETVRFQRKGCWGYDVGFFCQTPPHHHGLLFPQDFHHHHS